MKVRPLHDRVLVLRLPPPDTVGKEGKLYRPDVAKTPPQEAVVLAVGEGKSFDGPGRLEVFEGDDDDLTRVRLDVYERQAPVLKVGDIVLFGKFSGSEVELSDKGQTLFLLREDEVIAVIEEPDESLRVRADDATSEYDPEPVGH